MLLNIASTLMQYRGYDYDYYYDSAYDAGAVLGTSVLVWCCICSCILAFMFLIGFLVYRDAKNNNVDNPALWAIISGVSGIGLIIYLLTARADATKGSAPVAKEAEVVEDKKKEDKK